MDSTNGCTDKTMQTCFFNSDEAPEIGMVMSFADKAGTELPGVVKTIDGDRVDIDFNHPLAGRTLTFEVEVLNVTPITTH